MLNGKKVVLVVDDMFDYCNTICEELKKGGHEAFPVYDLQDVWQTIGKVPGGLDSVDLFIQDGSVSYGYTRCDGSEFHSPDGKLVRTLAFIRDLRASGYAGPILANSTSGHNNDQMIEAGATHHGHGDTLHPWVHAQTILAG